MLIGNMELSSPLILSPMAGFTDLAFRVLCRRQGAGLVCSEMVHSSAVLHDNPKTKRMMQVLEEERPTCVQLFGSRPEEVAMGCKKAARHADVIGFNFGCPASQIKASGCGAVLMDRPELMEALVCILRDSTKKPLLIKMRLGNMAKADYVMVAKRLERAGADGLIVHGRTAKQGYAGKADWNALARIKQAISIPFIANGDVVDGASAKECLGVTKADGIAIGRAALGDPGVFKRINHFLEHDEELDKPSPEEKLALFKDYLQIAQEADLGKAHVLRQAMAFTKGLPGGARLRERLAKEGVSAISDQQ